jgi:hypothetical protein
MDLMIIKTINNVIGARHLICPPFPIDYLHTAKSIPAIPESMLPPTSLYFWRFNPSSTRPEAT